VPVRFAQRVSGTGLALAGRAAGTDLFSNGMNIEVADIEVVTEAVAGLDAWLDSMRQPGGYSGPVAHWWGDCLDYTGPGLDWRYEGILIGYLNLWKKTSNTIWLQKAKRAGDDLVAGQLPSGNYRNSLFELNPGTGGTPHEAACDLAQLKLAQTLRNLGDLDWEKYFETAKRNLENFYIGRLWDETARFFRDDPEVMGFVPNKAATVAEALFALSEITGDAAWVECYALPTLQAVLEHQVSGGKLDGAISQYSLRQRKFEKFFPFYIARCIPGLLDGLAWSGDERYAESVWRAASFILRVRYPDGSFPQVVYPGNRVNRFPQWVAAVCDILRALDLARSVGVNYDAIPTLKWLLAGSRPDGAFRTAAGFGRATPRGKADDPRDDLPVVGWNDKAFRYLTGILLAHPPQNCQVDQE
jgi:hypothetical protein